MENQNNKPEEDQTEKSASKRSSKKSIRVLYREWSEYKSKEFDRLLENESQMRMMIKFFSPFWLAIIFVFILIICYPNDVGNLGYLFFIYFFTPLGMEIGVSVGLGLGIDVHLVVLFMLVIDGLSAMFLIWNLDYSRLIPGIGRLIKYSEEKGSKALKKYKWVDRLAFLGLVLFVMIPLYGTGSILGTIVGRILGVDSWKTWFAVVIGSGIRLTLLAIVGITVLSFV